jgi:hypothetical protein
VRRSKSERSDPKNDHVGVGRHSVVIIARKAHNVEVSQADSNAGAVTGSGEIAVQVSLRRMWNSKAKRRIT